MLWFVLAAAQAPESHARVSESLAQHLAQACGADHVQIDVLGLAWSVDVPAQTELHWSGAPCQQDPLLYLSVFEQGAFVGRYSLRPGMVVEHWGWVASGPAKRGAALEMQAALVPVWVPVPEYAGGPVVARVSVVAGESISSQNAAFGAELLAGEPVTLSVRRGSVELETAGELLADAALGDTVPVKNLQSGHVVQGVLGPNRRVQID